MTESQKKHILVVDDEKDLCELLEFNLKVQDYEVSTVNSAEKAINLDLETFDLFLLDVMMGEMSGYKLAEYIRDTKNISTPIIFLTAKTQENDKLTGFNIGADDYVSKPFSIHELIARVRAVLSRTQNQSSSAEQEEEETLSFQNLIAYPEQKIALLNDIVLPLTKTEFEILVLFLKYRNRIFTRNEMLDKCWTDNNYVSKRTIDVNINRLRKKISPYDQNIVTKNGYGYGFIE